jgi:hypothetical protein
LYSHLRFATSASLIAFGSMIVVGMLMLLPLAVERPLVASAEDPPAIPCKRQTWLHFDRSCLSRRGLPWVVAHGASDSVTAEVSVAAENVPEQALTETQHTPATVPQQPAQGSDIAMPEQATPVPPPPAEERQKRAIEAQARLPAPKRAARRDRAAKRPTNEALNAVRRFGDTLHDVPASAYAADGARRRIVIRPTSIQDVYYYSVPR